MRFLVFIFLSIIYFPVLAETNKYTCMLLNVNLKNKEHDKASYVETGPIGTIEKGVVSINFPGVSYIKIGKWYITGDLFSQGDTIVLKEHLGNAIFDYSTNIATINHVNTSMPRAIKYQCIKN